MVEFAVKILNDVSHANNSIALLNHLQNHNASQYIIMEIVLG